MHIAVQKPAALGALVNAHAYTHPHRPTAATIASPPAAAPPRATPPAPACAPSRSANRAASARHRARCAATPSPARPRSPPASRLRRPAAARGLPALLAVSHSTARACRAAGAAGEFSHSLKRLKSRHTAPSSTLPAATSGRGALAAATAGFSSAAQPRLAAACGHQAVMMRYGVHCDWFSSAENQQ